MSNLYVTEPAPNGKVIVDTTQGEIEVELWGKECPRAVRNFLALCMEGYYEGVIFHRIVPGFIAQTGDPTGTGMGGESFYGEQFNDEIHPRLRFNRRGLLGMANNGKRHTNGSQFFFTLDKADELTNKHTLFGRVPGNTLYNLVNIGNMDVDQDERPLHPPRIKGIRIVENPFDDIVPRITAEQRRAQQLARVDAKKDAELREKKAKAKKNTGLLSFGEAEELPSADQTAKKKKPMIRQDLVDNEPGPSKRPETYVDLPPSLHKLANGTHDVEKPPSDRAAVDLKAIRASSNKDREAEVAARQAEIKRMQNDLKRLKKRNDDSSESDSDSDTARKRRKGGPSFLEQELARYSTGRGRAAMRNGNRKGRKDEEDDLLREMGKFSKRVALAEGDDNDEDVGEQGIGAEGGEDAEGLEVDDDVGWIRHSLKFEVDEKELTRRAEDEYAVIDPRAKARQLKEDGRRDRQENPRGGRAVGDVGRARR